MSTKHEELLELKVNQEKKLEEVKNFKNSIKKRVFWLSIMSGVFTFLFYDVTTRAFGSLIDFTLIVLIVYSLVLMQYLSRYYLLKKKTEKEVKTISKKIYKLMKLNA